VPVYAPGSTSTTAATVNVVSQGVDHPDPPHTDTPGALVQDKKPRRHRALKEKQRASVVRTEKESRDQQQDHVTTVISSRFVGLFNICKSVAI